MSSKLRESLKEILEIVSPISTGDDDDPVERVAKIAEAALAEPIRNCDIGTAEEQYKRFRDMCFNTNCEGLVKHNTLSEYAFKWAQMPYKKEVSNDKNN
jgi:hypothetical protein